LLEIKNFLHTFLPLAQNAVTDDPGLKPDQRYARRKNTQIYIWKNQIKIQVFVDGQEYQSVAILAHWEGCGLQGGCSCSC
jgi:hypothetical protein